MQFLKFFANDRLLLVIVSVIALIFIIGLVGDIKIQNTISNWAEANPERIDKVEHQILSIIKTHQTYVLNEKERILKNLKSIENPNFEEFNKVITTISTNSIIASIKKNNELICWSKNYDSQDFLNDTTNFEFGETYFLNSRINSFLVVQDTFSISGNSFKLLLAEIIEKHYELNEDYFSEKSVIADITDEINTDFSIEFSPIKKLNKDGRKHSFIIPSNLGNSIGIGTFSKYSRENAVKDLQNTITVIQSLLTIIGFLLLGYSLYSVIRKYENSLLKFISLLFYAIVLRYLLIFLKFPQTLFSSEYLTSKFYYSDFGFGIAQSPIDLLITLFLTLIVFGKLFQYTLEFIKTEQKVKNRNLLFIVFSVFIGMVIYLLALRGFAAGIRGFVFDTSLRYFQDSSLTLTLPHFVMHVNVLILGLISLLGSVTIILMVSRFFRKINSASIFFSAIVLIYICGNIIFDLIQNHPQLTLLIKSIQIIIVFIITYYLLKINLSKIITITLFFVTASIISIISLLEYNSELEKASLKTTANIIARADDNWYKSLIERTLLEEFSRKEAIIAFSQPENNFNSSAFKIWSKSKLQDESINSSVNFISFSGELLGGFGSIYPQVKIDRFIDTNSVIEEIHIFEENSENESQKIIRGIFPIKDDFSFLGYLDVSILSDLNEFGFSSHPEFISTGKLNDKAILKLDKLDILDFRNGDLKTVYGRITPNLNLNESILNTEFSKGNDSWLDIEVNNQEYIIYVKKIITNKIERVLAIALRDKELSIRLFDFFKVFFSHAIVLLLIMFVYIISFFNKKHIYKYDLRARLLTAFLIISLIPLILTAYYFRNLTEEKNSDAIYYKLGKRAFNLESYLNENSDEFLNNEIFARAANDLNINYSFFRDGQLEFSSQDLLYDIGLISKQLDPIVYKKLQLENSQEILISESIDKFKYNSFYYKASVNGEDIILKVSDGFNKIRLPLSGSEVDVFLFGFYFFAAIMILIFSFIFANQISSPIRKITSATKSVAAGDLSLEINTNAKGELGELESGFNYMIKELNRNQKVLAEIEREEAWKEMAKQVAHEIKNPLTPMKLSVQQLITAYNDKSDKFDKFFHKVTTTILSQIETLKNIATEFSHFARMPKLKIEIIDCIRVVNSSINLFTDETVEINFTHPNSPALINGDSEQLKRTIINLVRNAIQAEAKEIKFVLSESHDIFQLTIEDNGKGISKENIARIFEPNFTTKEDGMGLGLSMAQRYLRSTGGNILIKKTSDEGTIIELTFLKKL